MQQSHFVVFSIFSVLFLTILWSPPTLSRSFPGIDLEPEFEGTSISSYANKNRLLRLQITCAYFNGPCDDVGRWIKPRAKAAIFGECQSCTKSQEKWIEAWLNEVITTFPDLYRAIVATFVRDIGVQLDMKEISNINAAYIHDFDEATS